MVNNGCGSSATFMSAAGVGTAKSKQQTANTKRNTKSKATTAMKTTKFFFLTANDNHSPFIFANQNLLKCCEFVPPPRALSPVLEMN